MRRAESGEPISVKAVLRGEDLKATQQAGHQGTDAGVAAAAALAEPAVDEGQRDSTPMHVKHKVRPQLELNQDDCGRAQPTDGFADGPGKVEGKIADVVAGKLRPGDRAARRRGGRNDEFDGGEPVPQLGENRLQLQHFAHADRMEPETGSPALADGNSAQKLFAPPRAVFAAQRHSPQQDRGNGCQQDEVSQIEEPRHAGVLSRAFMS